MEKYSVLMSVYYKDKAEYLECAIESMLKQTVAPEQFVIVEDGKLTDELASLISSYRIKFPILFTVIKVEKNLGLANALNLGLTKCRNELVARMDADDISMPTRCEKELLLFETYEKLVICGCDIDEFYNDVSDIRTSRIVPNDYEKIVKFARKRQPFNHPSVMYKKSVIQELGGYPNLKRKEDFDLFSRLVVSGKYARNINESLYLYRANESNYLRRKSKENLKAALYVYRLHLVRGGCNSFEYMEICFAEILFYLLPIKIMKKISDKILRGEVKNDT